MRASAPLFSFLLAISAQALDTLGLSNGVKDLSTANFDLSLVSDSQVLSSLRPSGKEFDFSPSRFLPYRAEKRSASARRPVKQVPSTDALGESDLAKTLPSSFPLKVTRKWTDINGDLGLTFTLVNTGDETVELGGVGFPIEFNSIFFNYTAEEALGNCSLIDPYIGLGGGYLQVTPTSGTGPALVITPLGDTPFEAWGFLEEPKGEIPYQSQVFEGFYQWQVLSKADAETEWRGVEPWNKPSSKHLHPGTSWTIGLRLSLAKGGVRNLGDTVQAAGTPYAVSVPGYIIPSDLEASLHLFTDKAVANMTTSPPRSFYITKDRDRNVWNLQPQPEVWGRVRLTYTDGVVQAVHYYITDSASEAIGKLGNFFNTKA
ncbi:hypothetical protein N7449_005436 [Penicillium cf. viridicatum]|uniref:Uncharacterized protein n=1 Tax=Penicillium cf. viridicatum TaxID=2972119 RepID=A0A9W9SZ44_9EURO|nr:hypothetical protein N7449_005436 [Penicillium cf. viridicatum]